MAQEIGMQVSRWGLLENGRIPFSSTVIGKIREKTGLDPHVVAFVFYGDSSKLPAAERYLILQLRAEWDKRLAKRQPNLW